ncbi:MAG: hypothetical protein RR721_08500 [Aeromonas sp.]|uniref:hypothetical protein n=1 Tax=Aeromonas sp. TaxID=647 RepID=UPI002FC6F76F
MSKLVILCCALLHGQAIAATILSNGRKVEETISLSASIDLSEEVLLGTVDIKPLTPLNEIAIWDHTVPGFKDLGLSVRVERLMVSPLKISVLRDNFSCAFGQTIVSNTSNREVFFYPEYSYWLQNTGEPFNNGKVQIGTNSWTKVEESKYIVDLHLRIRLPRIGESYLGQFNSVEGNCSGSTLFIFTLA